MERSVSEEKLLNHLSLCEPGSSIVIGEEEKWGKECSLEVHNRFKTQILLWTLRLIEVKLIWNAYTWWTQDQLSIRRHPHEDLKSTKLCWGPIQTRSAAFLGFLGKTKMKAYTQLTVVMCSQIVARKSVAASSGNFRQQPAPRYVCGHDQEFGREKVLVK